MQKGEFRIKKIEGMRGIMGFSLVEILLSVSIFTMTVLAMASFLLANDNSLKYSTQYNEANYYLNQGLEAVKNIKSDNYFNLNNGTFGLIENGSVWQLSGTSDNVNGFIRKIIITSPDALTKKIVAEVRWVNSNNQSQLITAGLTFKDWNRVLYSPAPTHTPTPTPTITPISCNTNATIDITCDNEFILYANGNFIGQDTSWQTSHNYQVFLNTGKNVIAVQAAGDYQTAQALIAQITQGTNKYYSDTNWKVTKNFYSGWNTMDYDASSWGNSVTYGNYGSSPWGTFGFPADTLSKWIWTNAAMVDSPVYFRFEFTGCPATPTPTITPTITPTPVPVNWSSPAVVLSQDLSSTAAVVDMVKVGNYIYGVRSGTTNNFFIANVTNPASPSYAYLSYGYNLSSIAVIDNTAYVGSDDNTREVSLINVTSKTAPEYLSYFSLSDNDNVTSLLIDSSINRLYIGRAAGSSRAELYIYNITNRTSPSLVTTYNMSGGAQFTNLYKNGNYLYATTTITSAPIHIVNLSNEGSISGTSSNVTGAYAGRAITGYGNRLFVSNSNSAMFALDISSPTSPSVLGSYSAGGVINSIAVDQTKQLAFVGVASTATGTNEFQAVNIATPASMSLYGYSNPTNNNSYVKVIYDSATDRNYIGTNISAGEFLELRPGP